MLADETAVAHIDQLAHDGGAAVATSHRNIGGGWPVAGRCRSTRLIRATNSFILVGTMMSLSSR